MCVTKEDNDSMKAIIWCMASLAAFRRNARSGAAARTPSAVLGPFPAQATRRDGPKVLVEGRHDLRLGVGTPRPGPTEQTREVIARRRRPGEASEKEIIRVKAFWANYRRSLTEWERHEATRDGALSSGFSVGEAPIPSVSHRRSPRLGIERPNRALRPLREI
jgi:hypothetical protein